MKKWFILFVLFHRVIFGATSCEMIINQTAHVKSDLGTMNLSKTRTNDIWLSNETGDKTALFNTDDLYEVTDSLGSRYFRLAARSFNAKKGQTHIYDVAYAFGVRPPKGDYVIKSYTTERKSIFGRTLDTVGDSITWWQHGRFLRCLMRDNGLMYDFRGSHYDVFGFGHDGAGGNTTQDILNRMDTIEAQDAYFLLVGTNDRITPQETVDNIKTIVKQLKNKRPCSKVYFSTLLPRKDEFNARNQSINVLLRASSPVCDGCTLIDLGGYFYGLSKWSNYMADDIHPNYAGYQVISAYLASLIN